MLIFILSEIKDAAMALDMAKELVVEAIDSANSNKNRVKRVKAVESKVKKLVSLCRAKKAMGEKGDWAAPVNAMKNSIQVLEDARQEAEASFWGI
tara:strand:+ start:116 stop:400 length:285 start_codon:yes stop_codon:yes gene_type:complete